MPVPLADFGNNWIVIVLYQHCPYYMFFYFAKIQKDLFSTIQNVIYASVIVTTKK
jgi:hypothetical protein